MVDKVLVVGAGPVGLTAAFALAQAGHQVVIVERNAEIVPLSKALGINARTLELFEPSGFDQTLVNAGRKLRHANLWVDEQRKLHINFSNLQHKTPFLLALPQNITEGLLEQALEKLGVIVQRKTELVGFEQNDGKVKARVVSETGENYIECDYLAAADGAHSFVRQSLGLDFSGKDYPEEWQLADVDMQWPYGDVEVNAFLNKDGSLIVCFPLADNRFRLIASHGDFLSSLPRNTQIDNIRWQSQFKIHCRIVDNYQHGRVFLMGDAAHIHSPVGGRGMNLGIEDAFSFAELLSNKQLAQYSTQRRKIGLHVLKVTDSAFRNIKTKNKIKIFVRNHFLFPILNLDAVQRKLLWDMSGLH